MRREGEVHLVHVRIVEARAHDGRLEIVVPDHPRHTAHVAEGVLVEPEERLEPLIPDRLFVACGFR